MIDSTTAEPFSLTPYLAPLLIMAVVAVAVFAGDNRAASMSAKDPIRAMVRGSVLRIETATASKEFVLQTPLLSEQNQTSAAVQIEKSGRHRLAAFSVTNSMNDRRDVCVWLVMTESGWSIAGEWFVDTFQHKELGKKNESQMLAFESDGSLRRRVERDNIDGIKTTCGDKCQCEIWQSRTLVIEEEEVWRWDQTSEKSVRTEYKKWYLTQPEENLWSIALKMGIGVERMTSLYYLNPGLQKMEKLPEGMRVLVERSIK